MTLNPSPVAPHSRLGLLGILSVAALLAAPVQAQQRPLEHDDVLTWQRIQDASLSADGSWVAYAQVAMEGDGTVHIRGSDGRGDELKVRGSDPQFTSDSRFVVYRVAPFESVVDSLKREGTKSSDLPKDSLGIAQLAGSSVLTVGPIESYKVPEEGAWVAFILSESDDADGPEGTGTANGDEQEIPEAKKKEDGKTLIVRNLTNGSETRADFVTEYVFSKDGSTLAFVTSSKDGAADGAFAMALASGTVTQIASGTGHYEQIALSNDGSHSAFVSDAADWASDTPEYSLYLSRDGADAQPVAASEHEGLPLNWIISQHGEVSFSDGGSFLHFGTAPRPLPEGEDDTPEDERVSVDIWNWKDPYLQPMQLVQLDEEKTRSYAAVVHLDDGSRTDVTQLGSPEIPTVQFVEDSDAAYAIGVTDVPYRQLISWDGRYQDVWSISLETGERTLLAQRVKGFRGAQLSPTGKFATWWDGADKHWKAARMDGSGTVEAPIVLSAESPHPVWNELDDHPDEPPPYGSAGWTEDDTAFLFYDRHDVYRINPESGELVNLTQGVGREKGMRFRYAAADPELDYVPEGPVWWQGFGLEDKRSGLFAGRSDRATAPSDIVWADKRFAIRDKADDSDRWLVTREDFQEFPDLHTTGGSFADLTRVSDANPQQSDYRWGTAELVDWTSNDGVELQGLLFKPDGFNAARQYPTMVYFYERMSDGLHQYRAPTPGSSSISIPFYVSRGYVVFVPDIPYEIGYPGESALDAVVPGVLSLIDEGFIDRERIGVQGHSWGGYQIAYMVTKTHLFAAAEAGAPVSNMTSAYGGIRWQTGMSRMFQYERTQSRIGGTLWESTQEYLHNSPLFFADKIETPLLMMHNDEDGAVPWYQGIEMFVSMRRLQKPVWMLNYNGEAHGLRQDHNRKDWAIRMQQFFDHYLMDAPAPIWMEEGVPALHKGKTLGTELTAPKASGVS